MPPWVQNCSREYAEMYTPEPGTVCISIWTPTNRDFLGLPGFTRRPANLRPGYAAVLRMCFSDMDSERGYPHRIPGETDADYAESVRRVTSQMIQPAQARRIADFIRDWTGHNFLIHCDAGISRSRAVAEAVLALYPHYVDNADGFSHFPNGRVKLMVKRALGLTPAGYTDIHPDF